MKKILLISTAILGFAVAHGQTNVSGFISTNTTWNLSGSPYIVVGNALVSQNVTLTIDPGVIVKFNNSKALQIDGTLIAIGSASNRIKFTSNQASPTSGDWAKLHFSNYSVDASFDTYGNYVSGCIMKYCDVLYAGGLGYGAIDVEQSSPYISRCRILNSAASGVYYNCNIAIIDSSSIRNCTDNGILFQTGHFLMQNDSITNNISGGILMWDGFDGIQSKVLNCYFASNNNAISWQYNGLHNTTISGNSFVNNSGAVIYMSGHFDTLTCNKFINNHGGPAIYWDGSINGGLIFNNLFQGNTNTSGASVIYAGAGYPSGSGGDTLIIANNIVKNNSSSGNSCCIFYSALDYFNSPEFMRIYDNIFTNNTGSNLIEMQGPQNSNVLTDFLYMKNNTFSNPNCQYELYNNIPYGAQNLYLDSNYWGSISTAHIDAVIYDYFDFANQSVVYYSPILTSTVILDTTCRPFPHPVVGIKEITKSQNYFSVYPNPTSDQFFIEANTTDKLNVDLYDVNGRHVFSKSVSDKSNIDVTNLNTGVYSLTIKTIDRVINKKLIIVR